MQVFVVRDLSLIRWSMAWDFEKQYILAAPLCSFLHRLSLPFVSFHTFVAFTASHATFLLRHFLRNLWDNFNMFLVPGKGAIYFLAFSLICARECLRARCVGSRQAGVRVCGWCGEPVAECVRVAARSFRNYANFLSRNFSIIKYPVPLLSREREQESASYSARAPRIGAL